MTYGREFFEGGQWGFHNHNRGETGRSVSGFSSGSVCANFVFAQILAVQVIGVTHV
jgi:hypothetical protein